MAVICRAAFSLLVSLLGSIPVGLAAQNRHLMADFDAGPLTAVEAKGDQPVVPTNSNGTPQYLHAICAVFLDNSTIFTAEKDGRTIMYRGMTATVINYAANNVSVPWSFEMSSDSPGYSGIEQAYNFANSRIVHGTVSGTATQPSLTLLPKAANNITIGLLLQANATTFPVPRNFILNDHSCSVVILPNNIPLPANLTSPTPQDVQAEAGVGLTTINGQIIDRTSGQPISLKGFNWFGFDNAQTCVDGLWAGSTTLSQDLVTIIRTQQVNCSDCVALTVLHCLSYTGNTVASWN